jgi:hypothetical protein
MTITTKQFNERIQKRDYVSVSRHGIDEHSVHGFVLAVSETLVLLQHVTDFRLDGYLLLRRADITEMEYGSNDQFHKKLLVEEGVMNEINFDFNAPIQSFESFLVSRKPDEIVIVEDAQSESPEYVVGTVLRVAGGKVHLRHFDVEGRWSEQPAVIALKRITSCMLDTNYTKVFQRYFERHKAA